MFAYRLAAKLGVVDADALMNSLTDEQLLEWQAVAIIDGWFNGWSHTAEMIAYMNTQTNRQILSRVDPKNSDRAANSMSWKSGSEIARMLTDFKPRKKAARRSGMLSPAQAAEVLKARYSR